MQAAIRSRSFTCVRWSVAKKRAIKRRWRVTTILASSRRFGETVWYVAIWREQWVAQLSLSAAALKCGVRDRWIGWDFRSQYGRLKLIANISRSSESSEQQRTRLATGCGAICRGQIGVLVKRVLGLIMPPTTKLVRRSTSSLMSSEA